MCRFNRHRQKPAFLVLNRHCFAPVSGIFVSVFCVFHPHIWDQRRFGTNVMSDSVRNFCNLGGIYLQNAAFHVKITLFLKI
jgi:hypothetical protein